MSDAIADAQASDDMNIPRPFVLRRRVLVWTSLGIIGLLLLIIWFSRTSIADHFVRQELEKRGVPASYTIEQIGFGTQRLTNVVIGDPAHPDLMAERVEIDMGYGGGPGVSAIRATGVRLYGAFVDGRLSLGALDKFRDPTSTDPFALPDLAVELRDARARIATPWGAIGAALNGRGNLRNDFTGTLALVAPQIAAGGCSVESVSFYGQLKVESVEPKLRGPLRGRSIACASNGLSAALPQIALDLALSEDLQNWRGDYSGNIAAIRAAGFRAKKFAAKGGFSGNARKTIIDTKGELADLSGGGILAAMVGFDANAVVGSVDPELAGSLRFSDAAASQSVRQWIVRAGGAAKGSPISPLAEKAAAALVAALAKISGSADFSLVGGARTRRLELIAPEFTAASGAKITASPESRVAYLLALPEPAFLVAGRWQVAGGDLPTSTVQLDRRPNGMVSGVATLQPYAADSARLALTPVRFSGGRDGRLQFDTMATLSGPVAGGRLDGLAVPLNGHVDPTGAFALRGGCTQVRLESAKLDSLILGRNQINLCSRAGQPLLATGRNGLSGSIILPDLALRGATGASPLLLQAKRGEIDLASFRFSLAMAEIMMGEVDATTAFVLDSLTGRSSAKGFEGSLSGGQGHIGSVPLLMSEVAGDWTWTNGTLNLDGAIVVSDREPDARFFPLISNDARLRYANGVIDATAAFAERETRTKILDAVIRHQLKGDGGFAELAVNDLRFNDRFQPDQLTRLALGVVANVEGSVVGNGRIDWNDAGVTSRGTFATAGTNLAAAFGPVNGLTTTLIFDDLLGLHSPPRQRASIEEVNPGIPVIGGMIDYQLLGNSQIRIEGGEWPFAGGKLLLHPTTLDFGAEQVRRLTFDINGVDAAVFLQQFGFDNISATGVFDGTLPVEFDGLGGRIVGGRLDSRYGGGTLAYVGELSNQNLGVIANFAFNALKSLKYDDLSVILNGDLDGEIVTDIRFGGVGQGAGASSNFITKQVAALPLVFNVKIRGPFRQLITSAKGYYDPSLLVEQNLQALIEAQEAMEREEEAPPVQPSESEPMP